MRRFDVAPQPDQLAAVEHKQSVFEAAVERLYELDELSICTAYEFAVHVLTHDPASMQVAERSQQLGGDPSNVFGKGKAHPSFVDILEAARRKISGVQVGSKKVKPNNKSEVENWLWLHM